MKRERWTWRLALLPVLFALHAGSAAAASPRCTVELEPNAPASTINKDLAKTAFTVVCLKRGTRSPQQAGGRLVLNGSPSVAFNYLEAKPGSQVAIEGGVVFAQGASHLALNGFHITGAVQVLGGSNVLIEKNDFRQQPTTASSAEAGVFCVDCTKVGIYLNRFHGFQNAPGEESNGRLITGGEGDAVHFQGVTDSAWILSNEFYADRSIAGGPAPGDNACIRAGEGPLVGYIEIAHNYFHDNDCLGPLIQSEQPSLAGARVIYNDNLMVRNSVSACEGTGEACTPEAVNFFLDDPYTAFEASRDTEIENEGGATITKYDREEPVKVGHSLFDLMHRGPWCEVSEVEEPPGSGESVCPNNEYADISPYTTSEWNYIQGAASQWVGGEHEQPESGPFAYPEFNCTSLCGQGHTPANDDYRIRTNPNGIGVTWAPVELKAGPEA